MVEIEWVDKTPKSEGFREIVMAISPNKRLKTLTSVSDPSTYISEAKTKIKIEVENDWTDRCGICLSEACNGEVSRGFIDSCSHCYCFVCIMEWAKVESKCPLCKRRFSTIRRPPKPPVFTSERVVRVPVRDQVYHCYGNATVGPRDPYSEAKCSVCHGIEDESFILLCDLCDSAAHTYCAGLGLTVPEGDWYCQDCALLRDEHLKSESNVSLSNENVTASDIVQESFGNEVQRSRSASSDPCSLPPPTFADGTTMINNINQSSSTSTEIVAQLPKRPNTRTLQHCRNVHDRIRILRENWNSVRSGNLCFSSSQKPPTFKSGQPSISCLNKQSIAQLSSDIKNDSGTHEIQKAWKMMDKARSKHQTSSIVRPVRKSPIRKPNAVKNAAYKSHRHLPTDSHQNGSTNVGNMLPGQQLYCSLEMDFFEQPSSVSGKEKGKRHVTKDVCYRSKASESSHSSVHQELKLSKGVQTCSYMYDGSVSSEKQPADKPLKGPDCSTLAAESEPVVLNTYQVKGVDHASSSHRKEARKLEKNCVESQHYNDAKSEIQSLVKLNLKLQTKEEKIEVEAFKEVARLATHSILTACGLEQPRSGCCLVPGFVCPHPNSRKCLMPTSCRECFYALVKDVVDSCRTKKTQKRTQKNL